METVLPYTLATTLCCSNCGKQYAMNAVQTYASCCNSPLVMEYELPEVFLKDQLMQRPSNMWRYHEMLPVQKKQHVVSLGEGMTPLFRLKNLSARYDLPHLYIKDESQNPTGSFKARGLSVAVSKALELGIDACIIPTAGNAGGAMAAYCAAAGIHATVVMPAHTPQVFKDECLLYGAELLLVKGLINDCGKTAQQLSLQKGSFNLSTMKEPFRLEGKKTMGYEIAEQMHWQLPDVILYPTGGGTGLIGMWKAFKEMAEAGWIPAGHMPRMIAVQAANCQPIVQKWQDQTLSVKDYQGKSSIANGLAVPHPFAVNMIMEVLQESGGMPVAVADDDMIKAVKIIAGAEGLLVAPEGGALLHALLQLTARGIVKRDEKILLLNTGSGYKYMENIVG